MRPARRACCQRRYHTHGVDPNAMLTSGQLTLAVCKTELQCAELHFDGSAWSETKHYRPRFLPMTTLPQSFDALADELGVERQEPDAKVAKLPWGRIRHAGQLAHAVTQLDPPDREAAVARLEAHDATLIPVLDRAMDKFVRKAVYGGRTEPYETLFEPKYLEARCDACAAGGCGEGGGVHGGGEGKGACADCAWVELATRLEPSRLRARPTLDPDGFEWDLYYYDLCSQYPTELMGDLPCGKGRWLTRAELDALERDPAALQGFYGFLKVDVVVNKTHPVWARYPVLPERKPVHGAKTLVWDCVDKQGQVYFSEELKKAVACGNAVVKVHQGLAFERQAYLKQFIDVFRTVKEDIDRQPKAERNPAMRQAVKDILNMLYGKTLQVIREAESLLVDETRLWELVLGERPKRLLYNPRMIRDDGADSCYSLTVAKEWSPATGLPPCIGAAVLGNSKVRWYTMLEAGVSLGMIPITGDTDSLMFAAPKGVTLEEWRPAHARALPVTPDALRAELKDGIVSDSAFGKASNELEHHRLLAIAAPLAKFYSLLLAVDHAVEQGAHRPSCTQVATERYFPQTLGQWRAALADVDGDVATEMREALATMDEAQIAAMRCYDAAALAAAWAKRLGLSCEEAAPTIAQLEVTTPCLYTKLKSIKLVLNELQLNYLAVRNLVLEQHAHYERGGDKASAPRLTVGRAQLKKRKHMLDFTSSENHVGADYAKRRVLPRDAEWETRHAALRITSVPHGYEGPVW